MAIKVKSTDVKPLDVKPLDLKPLGRKDFGKAISFAITGMHFERYTENRTALSLYGRYFLYMEMERATQIIAAYDGHQLAGVLMADMKGEPKRYHSILRALYVKIFGFLMNHIFAGASSSYDSTNRKMLAEYKKEETPDGELCFLAADPRALGKGIGSRLLTELERREDGKKIYLFTDSNCSWQFYEHKGFDCVGKKEIMMDVAGREVPLTCLLYAKTMKLA